MTSSPPAVLAVVLRGAIDYAGLFPPASLGMDEAVASYASYVGSGDAWALGRFIAPLGRLEEFEKAVRAQAPTGGMPWHISVLTGISEDALETIAAFNTRHPGRFLIDAVEGKAADSREVLLHVTFVEARLLTYIEIAPGEGVEKLVHAIRGAGARAKLRTGGITAESFPQPRDVLRFLRACHQAGVGFKATAGLHHPLRGAYRLTYSPDSALGTMFGYVNLFASAALIMKGADDAEVLRALCAGAEGFDATDRELRIGGVTLSHADLAAVRPEFVSGFGSCSFREPLDDIARLVAA